MAGQDKMCCCAHSNEGWQRDQGYGRKTAELDFRLAELGRFGRQYKIAEGGEFHAAAKAATMNCGDFQAAGGGEPAKDSMKRGEHFLNALRSMIRDLRPSGKGFLTRAPKNHEITFGKSAFQHRIKRLHHRNVENVEWRAIERNPRRSMFEPKLNRFVAGGHDCRGASTGKTTCLEISEAAFRKRLE